MEALAQVDAEASQQGLPDGIFLDSLVLGLHQLWVEGKLGGESFVLMSRHCGTDDIRIDQLTI